MVPRSCGRKFFVVLILFFFAVSAFAANAPTITLSVDASAAPRKISHAQLHIPAAPGTLSAVGFALVQFLLQRQNRPPPQCREPPPVPRSLV